MADDAKPRVVAIIPARYASTRFEGKVVADLAGKPLVQRTYERALRARLLDDVVIAVDDPRVAAALAPHGAHVVMTRADHPSGTDRIAEVAETLEADIVVNLQGDEPLIDPETINRAVQALIDHPEIPMATVRYKMDDPRDAFDPNVVKVVCDSDGRALYFSRSPIPHVRGVTNASELPPCYWQHIGIYVYRRDFLMLYAHMEPSPLEELEKLEQLRVLEHGYPIAVVETKYKSIGVDTPEDLERVRKLWTENVSQ